MSYATYGNTSTARLDTPRDSTVRWWWWWRWWWGHKDEGEQEQQPPRVHVGSVRTFTVANGNVIQTTNAPGTRCRYPPRSPGPRDPSNKTPPRSGRQQHNITNSITSISTSISSGPSPRHMADRALAIMFRSTPPCYAKHPVSKHNGTQPALAAEFTITTAHNNAGSPARPKQGGACRGRSRHLRGIANTQE